MKNRYDRNIDALTLAESEALRGKKVCVVGCGGLGGYILEFLLRLGIGHITAIDGDCFDVTNLNRQLLSDERFIGESKAFIAKERAKAVNSQVDVSVFHTFLTEENAEGLLKDHDLVIDAVDNIPARKIMGKACDKLGIPLVYGAIQGWYAQISLILPGSPLLDILYPDSGVATNKSSLSFTPAVCASYQVAEAVKYLCGRECSLIGKVLYVDLLSMENDLVEFC